MSEGFLKAFDSAIEVFSAGTHPAASVNPYAVEVMQEAGIDLSSHRPKHVDQFLEQPLDFVVTVCSDAERECPTFGGMVARRVHIGFDDPARATGGREEVLAAFRRVRDEIRSRMYDFYLKEIKPNTS
jgi:arsenate reductase